MQVSGLEERLAVVESRDAARREQLRCIAHELASPLTPMRLQLAVWKQIGVDLPGVQLLERNIERMYRLVGDVADLAWLEAKGLRMNATSMDLRDIVEDVVDSFAARAASRGIKLSRRMGGSLLAIADQARIAQVLDNLLRNALKFTPSGGTILVEAQKVGDLIQMSVADTGRGMAEHERARLFRPYSQLRSADSQMGTGLGLFICKNIVGAHRGNLWVRSDGHGKGSRFIFEIPAAGATTHTERGSSSEPTVPLASGRAGDRTASRNRIE